MSSKARRGWLMSVALVAALGCGAPAADPLPAPDPGPDVDLVDAPPTVRIPMAPPVAAHAPSNAASDGPLDVALMADVESCGRCHEDALAQHRGGPHAHASFDNPWYRAVVDDLRENAGLPASRHCGGCHDPLLLFSGAMDRPIEPGDPYTNAGVTCLVCHSITSATTDGNGSYTLTNADPLIPDPNVPAEVDAHRARMAPDVLRSPLLCASCHRGFLHEASGTAAFLAGIDEPGAWRGSAWAGQFAARIDPAIEHDGRDCRGCHMTPETAAGDFSRGQDGTIASHRFAGGHSALAHALGDEEQSRWVTSRMRTAATIDVVAVDADGPVGDTTGDEAAIDVVVRNVGVGHRFPGGIRDARAHFVRVTVTDASGATVLATGDEDGVTDSLTLRTEVVDEDGAIETAHRTRRFRALAADHTIAPRDALLVRYALPADVRWPLEVHAELVARRHRTGLRTLACDASRSERGRAFLAASPAPIDGCAEEPLVVLAEVHATVGPGLPAPSPAGLYVHGLALLHDVSERLDEARPSFAAALAGTTDAPGRAAILVALAELEGREGRTDEALGRASEAETLIGAHPAIDRARGRAFAAVWRWAEAAEAFDAVARAAPMDTEALRDLARARGSLREDRAALEATARGLALLPRDEAMLRTQALALEALADPRASEARAAFLTFRRPDDETSLRFACDRDPVCRTAREPIPRFAARSR